MPHYPKQTRYRHSTPYGQRGLDGIYRFYKAPATQSSRASVIPQVSNSCPPQITSPLITDTLQRSVEDRDKTSSPNPQNSKKRELSSTRESVLEQSSTPIPSEEALSIERAESPLRDGGKGNGRFWHVQLPDGRKLEKLTRLERKAFVPLMQHGTLTLEQIKAETGRQTISQELGKVESKLQAQGHPYRITFPNDNKRTGRIYSFGSR